MKRIKISMIMNIGIVLMVTICSILMFEGIKITNEEALLESSKIQMFRYFTVDSNILVGIVSLILVIYESRVIKERIEIPNWVYIGKMMGTSAVTLTFLTTLFFLAPQYGFIKMFQNNNLFFHAIIPIFAIISYVFFEKHKSTNKDIFLGMIPMILYSIYYIGNVLVHLENGGLTYQYDFYGFLQGNIHRIYIMIPIIYLFTYCISYALITLNKKIGGVK